MGGLGQEASCGEEASYLTMAAEDSFGACCLCCVSNLAYDGRGAFGEPGEISLSLLIASV